MEPSLQAEHCRRMAEEAQVTEEEIAAMVVPKAKLTRYNSFIELEMEKEAVERKDG